jgi:hypothetical protein
MNKQLTLACSCRAAVVVPIIIMLPRHSVVRIVECGPTCAGLDHIRGRRVVVVWRRKARRRAFRDVRDLRAV